MDQSIDRASGAETDVPGVLGGDLAELLHALRLPRVHARVQDVLRNFEKKNQSGPQNTTAKRPSSGMGGAGR
jgi:hypothetical protein